MKLFHRDRIYTNYGLFLACFLLFCGKTSGNIFPKLKNESVQAYLEKADSCIRNYAIDQAKIYIDSAALYEKQINDPSVLGFLYSIYGDYYSFKLNEWEAHSNYYKAIAYYEKAGKTDYLIEIYHNLAFSYIQKHDTETLKKIIDKLLSISSTQNENENENENENKINTYRIIAFYYGILYEKEKLAFSLDSAIYYDKQAISIYETTASSSPSVARPEDIAYNYLNVASNLLEKSFIHPDTVDYYLAKAENLAVLWIRQ